MNWSSVEDHRTIVLDAGDQANTIFSLTKNTVHVEPMQIAYSLDRSPIAARLLLLPLVAGTTRHDSCRPSVVYPNRNVKEKQLKQRGSGGGAQLGH
ncbi:hypothetical protein THAOC_31226 [Thalassiosira oceanica]|uniref:Uncharacterized protein n=1 Tax=Thalassiosira oceanica TaxID=159749 RepID=K0RC54_THAOC|nr:hypothetical protein THAOC_31226 [Thalassiosira oceanica]|eukprot:EJK49859.1 hypothetical protein THAOC_31226 [Thalassiosira oceanica]